MPATRPYRNRETREIARGEGLQLQFTVYSNLAHTTTTDISAANISLTWKLAKKTDDTALITKVSGVITQIEKTDPSNGVFVVKLATSDTTGLEVGSYRYDALLVDTSTTPTTEKLIARGDIVIIEAVAL